MENRTGEPKQLEREERSYQPPAMKKHDPIKIIMRIDGRGNAFYSTCLDIDTILCFVAGKGAKQ